MRYVATRMPVENPDGMTMDKKFQNRKRYEIRRDLRAFIKVFAKIETYSFKTASGMRYVATKILTILRKHNKRNVRVSKPQAV